MASLGRKWGLTLLWKSKDQVKIHNYSLNHISTWILDSELRDPLLFTSFYGELETHKRILSWSLLNQINHEFNSLWLILRDFNEILSQHEKKGGRPCSEYLMHNFITTFDTCKLFDLGHKGNFFTWRNRHDSDTYTKERLDGALAT